MTSADPCRSQVPLSLTSPVAGSSSPAGGGAVTATAVNVTVDMTPLSYEKFGVDGIGYPNTSAWTLSLKPGTRHVLGLPGTPSWQQIPVTVDASGRFAYDAQYHSVLTGRGTAILGLARRV